MKDGAPNEYTVLEFDGSEYSLVFHATGRPAGYQMNLYAPEVVAQSELAHTAMMPSRPRQGTHVIEVRAEDESDQVAVDQRVIRVES